MSNSVEYLFAAAIVMEQLAIVAAGGPFMLLVKPRPHYGDSSKAVHWSRGQEDCLRPGELRGLRAATLSKDANGQALAYVYGSTDPTHADADIAKTLTRDEARRVARNIAKLPVLLRKPS